MQDEPEIKKHPVCTECGGDDVSVSGACRFDKETNDWSLSATYDDGFCETCEGECKFNWVETT